jgi:26S proteasome regulatory subunit N2
MDAAGRNVTISLHTQAGQPDMAAVLGVFSFLHHWYFYSMTHCVALAFRPTCVIALNKNLQVFPFCRTVLLRLFYFTRFNISGK